MDIQYICFSLVLTFNMKLGACDLYLIAVFAYVCVLSIEYSICDNDEKRKSMSDETGEKKWNENYHFIIFDFQ